MFPADRYKLLDTIQGWSPGSRNTTPLFRYRSKYKSRKLFTMKYPLPIKVLFGFIILLTILGLVVKISFGAALSTTLYSLIPTAIILYWGFLLVRKGQKKREHYHSKFSNSDEST